MRVSKIVREYIEKSVRTAYEEKYGVTELRRTAERSGEKIDKAKQEVYEAARLAAVGVIETYKQMHPEFEYNPNVQFEVRSTGYRGLFNREKVDDMFVKWRDAKEKTDKKIKHKVEEIIVTLELGGNKHDLDRILTQLSEEE